MQHAVHIVQWTTSCTIDACSLPDSREFRYSTATLKMSWHLSSQSNIINRTSWTMQKQQWLRQNMFVYFIWSWRNAILNVTQQHRKEIQREWLQISHSWKGEIQSYWPYNTSCHHECHSWPSPRFPLGFPFTLWVSAELIVLSFISIAMSFTMFNLYCFFCPVLFIPFPLPTLF